MSLEIIVGCMFSGKSTEIMKIYNRLDKIDKQCLLVNPIIDNRYTNSTICTHDFIQRKCTVRDKLLPLFSNNEYLKSEYIIIEEAQFFTDLEPFVMKAVDGDKKHVIVVGLDGDSNRANFGEIHKLIPLCDTITKLKAFCHNCKDGTLAIFSKRIDSKIDKTYIGGVDKYMAVCRKCYLE